MNPTLLRGARCSTLVVSMTLAGVPGVAVAQESNAASDESPSLSVVYYPSSDLVSINSHSTPLQRILNEISRPVFLTVKPLEPIPDRLVSVEIDKLSVEDAVRQLLSRALRQLKDLFDETGSLRLPARDLGHEELSDG